MSKNYCSPEYWKLIAKSLTGELSEAEHQQFQLLLEDPDFHKEYEIARDIWKHAKELKGIDTIHLQSDKEKVFRRIHTPTLEFLPKEKPGRTALINPNHRTFFKVAATVIIMIGLLSILSYILSKKETNMLVTNASEKTAIKLSDNSHIHLNKGAVFSYPEHFEDTLREVFLEGEAFFEVQSDSSRPFLVHTENSVVRVYGTSFNVISTKNLVEVVVKTGKVGFSIGNKEVILEVGDKGACRPSTKILKKMTNEDENYLSWKTGKMIFVASTLREVVLVLEKQYGVHILMEESFGDDYLLTASFENQPLPAVLNVISETLGVEFTEGSEEFYVRKNKHFHVD